MNNQTRDGIKLILIGLLLAGCGAPTGAPAPTEVPPTEAPVATEAPRQEIANPASENCVKQGGTLAIEERGDGGQIGAATSRTTGSVKNGPCCAGNARWVA